MTATVSPLPAAGTTRPSAPSLSRLAALEMRKSLSTRSGRAVAIGAVLLGPTGVLIGSFGGEGTAPAAPILGIAGMLTSLVLLALGVLSTAGEWTHKSVQTTFLLVPQRGRVMASKVPAMAVLGTVLAAAGAAATTAMLAATSDPIGWTGFGRAVMVAIAAGAAMAVTGAGIGAALGNSPAALTGTYLLLLGVMPFVNAFKPAIGDKLDPVTSIIDLAQYGVEATPVLVIVGWVVVSTVLGTVITRRRAVS